MKSLKNLLLIVLLMFLVVGAGFFVIFNYSWVFSKTIQGEIIEMERITEPTAILGAQTKESQIHSYAVLIQDRDGEMYTSSAEDRQWQVAKKGYCVIATLYRYPPWDLNKGGTFFNARVRKLYRCPGKEKGPDSDFNEEASDTAPTQEPANSSEEAPAKRGGWSK
ncbi:MAG: hypothetical protein CL676_07925 [Bdellovibrionaceae bacterium]|nr:hypothetical protein [Pseudobdellovibrionaceae bacterium]